MNIRTVQHPAREESLLASHRVLRNTYMLLSMTLAWSALIAGLSAAFRWPAPGMLLTFAGYFGLLFLTQSLRNSPWGILSTFALTGFMGLTLGPVISFYLTSIPNGDQLIMLSFGGTAAIFLGLSGYALTSRRNFSFLGGFLFAGVLVVFLASIAAAIFNLGALMLAVSAAMVLLMSMLILWQTSAIINGGETNYIMATVSLYVSLYNLFLSLLHLLSAFSGRE